MLLTSKIERRKLLIGVFMLLIASHVLTAVAWNFTTLVISRAGVALAHFGVLVDHRLAGDPRGAAVARKPVR